MRGAAVALGLLALVPSSRPSHGQTPPSSNRVALVIGEGAYRSGARPAAPDDAGLVAQMLAGAGFDVTGARDLDGDALRRAVRDFLDRAGAAGPDGIAVIYLSGRAVQADGDDYFVPVDARLARPSDVPIETLRLADMTHALAALPIQARVVVVDGAYAGGPVSSAPGLALLDAEQGELLAFNAAPGTVAPTTSGPYGVYAQALVDAMKQGGVPIAEVFDRVRLAVNQATRGAVVPWESDKLTRSFAFFDRAPGAPAVASAQVPFAALEKRPLRDFPPDQAYDVAVARGTLQAYAEFLAAFPADPLARRVRLLQAALREASFWRAAVNGNTPGALWTYLVRYPKGPHAVDARRRLTRLAAAALPPPRFVPLGFDVPPPGPDEVLVGPVFFDAPDLPPPPLPPVFLLPPPVEVILVRPPPPPGPIFLPVPLAVAIPSVRAPAEPGLIAPPRGIAGDYPRARPYARGPNGDGLIVQVPQRSDEARPRLGTPNAPMPQPAEPTRAAPGPVPQPVVPQPVPQPQRPAASQLTPKPVPASVLPVPPAPPTPAAPRAPVAPIVPVARPLPTPSLPVPPTSPGMPTPPPAGRPAAVPPAALSPSTAPHPLPQPTRDRPAAAGAPVPPTGAPSAPPSSPAPARPDQHFPKVAPSAPPDRQPMRPQPAPSSVPPPHKPLPPTVVAPPTQPLAPKSEVAPPPAPRPAPPERNPVSSPVPRAAPALQPPPVPHPAASERPAPEHTAPKPDAAHPPGDRHPSCGHPGEPPCRP